MNAELPGDTIAHLTEALENARRLQNLSTEILGILNGDSGFSVALDRVAAVIRASGNWDGVGIRLLNDGDFQFAASDGYSPSFVAAENTLIARNATAEASCNSRKSCGFGCICGFVVAGRGATADTAFTPGGSFWMNRGVDSPDLRAVRQAVGPTLRSSCMKEGFHSMAIMPIRAHRQIIGLLQLSSRQPNQLTVETVQFFEGLSAEIGLAVTRMQAETALRKSEAQYHSLFSTMTEGFALHEMVYDANGKASDYRFLNANAAFERIVGLSLERIIGSTVRQVLPQISQEWIDCCERVTTTGEQVDRVVHLGERGEHFRVVAFRPQEGQFATLIEDVSERIRAAETLRKTEALQRTVISNISDVIAIIDPSGLIRFKSSNIERLFGWRPEEVVGREALDNVHPDDRESVQSVVASVLGQPDSTGQGQCRYRCQDGSFLWIEFTATNLLADPDVCGVLLNYHDISERKRIEDALHKSHDIFAKVTAQVPGMVYQFHFHPDGHSSIPYSSPGLRTIYELTPEEVVQDAAPVFERLHAEDRNNVMRAIEESARTLELFHVEFRVVLPRQGLRWRLCDAKPERMTDGGTLWHGIVSDISERKWAEDALRKSEEQYRLLFRMMTEGFALHEAILDGQGVPVDYRYLDANPAFERITGISVADAIGHTVREVLPRWGSAQIEARCRVAVTGEPLEHEGYDAVSGRYYRMIVFSPQRGQFATLYEDTTARNLAEAAQREQHDELERFTYTVSHDLKSPLVTIQTFLTFLEQDLAANDTMGLAKDVNFIRNAANKMSELLDELLKLSRVGRVASAPTEVLLSAVVDEALSLVAGRFATRGVAVQVDQEPILLVGDHRRLVELYQNLLDNAAKFMGSQPEPRVELGAEFTREGIVMYVRDNGIGFEPQHQERLFNLFEKLDPEADGTGMGLALVRRIVQLHGGTIWAESVGSGRGATFKFTLARTKRSTGTEKRA